MFGKFGAAMGAGARNIGRGMAGSVGGGGGGGPVNTGPGGVDYDQMRGGRMGAAISGGLGALAQKYGDPQMGGAPNRQILAGQKPTYQMNIPQIPQMQSGLPGGQMPGQQMPLPQVPPTPDMPINTGPSQMPPGAPQFGGLPPGMGGFRGTFGGQQQDPRFRF